MVNKWKQFFVNLYELEDLTFRRNLKPCGTCAYIKWQIDENLFVASVIVAKNKIAPVKPLSIPCLELCGVLMAAKLRETIIKQFNWDFESVFHIVDLSRRNPKVSILL